MFHMCDSCLCAAGSVPATGFLKQSGIHMDSRGFITVNKACRRAAAASDQAVSFLHFVFSTVSQAMQTNADGVLAGGDAVTFPFPPRHNKKVNIPHWQMAHVHGGCVTAGPSQQAWDLRIKELLLFFRTGGRPQHDGQSC